MQGLAAFYFIDFLHSAGSEQPNRYYQKGVFFMKKTKLIHRIGTALIAAAVCVTSIFSGNALKAEAAGEQTTSQIQPITVNSSFDPVESGLIAWHYVQRGSAARPAIIDTTILHPSNGGGSKEQ